MDIERPQVVVSQELPSAGFFKRLDRAIANWREARGERTAEGMKPTELLGLLRSAFPSDAPNNPSSVAPWLAKEPSLPGLDSIYMLAVSLKVRPEWLAFGFEPMQKPHQELDERPYERPPGSADSGRGKRTG